MRQVYAGMLSSDQLQALNQLKKLDAQVYSDAFQIDRLAGARSRKSPV